MKNNRRDFIKLAVPAVAGVTMLSSLPAFSSDRNENLDSADFLNQPQKFNMSGYAAPKIETVRIAFIGTGNRAALHAA